MSSPTPTVIGIVLVTGILAALGGWIGTQYGLRQSATNSDFHQVLHNDLGLTSEQEGLIADLESQFAAKRKSLDEEMSAANRELAAAILTEHAYGDQAKSAIERFHTAMGTLQEETIKHILAMRAVLTPEQASKFDQTVSEALAPDPS